jgi:UrcA family protein
MFANFLRSTLAVAVATSATLVIVAGSAAPVAAAESVTVYVGAWNLSTPAGRAAAENAIADAAEQVCDTGTPEQAAAAKASRACYRTVMATTLPQLDTLAANHSTNNMIASITVGATATGL